MEVDVPTARPQGMAVLAAAVMEVAPQSPAVPAVAACGLGMAQRIPGMGRGSGVRQSPSSYENPVAALPLSYRASPARSVTPVNDEDFSDAKEEPAFLPKKPNLPASMMTGLSRADLDKFRQEVDLKKRDSIYSMRPPKLKGTKKPPPHFLVVKNWDLATYNVR